MASRPPGTCHVHKRVLRRASLRSVAEATRRIVPVPLKQCLLLNFSLSIVLNLLPLVEGS
jgi:hypothetical protein